MVDVYSPTFGAFVPRRRQRQATGSAAMARTDLEIFGFDTTVGRPHSRELQPILADVGVGMKGRPGASTVRHPVASYSPDSHPVRR